MTVETVLIALLEENDITVYPDNVPEKGSLPAVVFQRISTPQIRTHSGVAMSYPRIQLSCWATTREAANTLAESVKALVDLNQENFKLAVKESEFDTNEIEQSLFRRILEFFIWTEGD